jgi:hypothetical protein
MPMDAQSIGATIASQRGMRAGSAQMSGGSGGHSNPQMWPKGQQMLEEVPQGQVPRDLVSKGPLTHKHDARHLSLPMKRRPSPSMMGLQRDGQWTVAALWL